MKPVQQQLADFLKAHAGQKYASGDLQRMQWHNKDNTLATPYSIGRRLKELAAEGILKVEYGNKNHAFYYWGNPVKTVKEVEYVIRDGQRFARIIEKMVAV